MNSSRLQSLFAGSDLESSIFSRFLRSVRTDLYPSLIRIWETVYAKLCLALIHALLVFKPLLFRSVRMIEAWVDLPVPSAPKKMTADGALFLPMFELTGLVEMEITPGVRCQFIEREPRLNRLSTLVEASR